MSSEKQANMEVSLKESISQAVVKHIEHNYSEDLAYGNRVLIAVRKLLQNAGYSFPSKISAHTNHCEKQDDAFQDYLAKINEKETRRRNEGVYYTDRDVTDFIAINALLHYVESGQKEIYGVDVAEDKVFQLPLEKKMLLLSATVFDPTCGTGEFLLSVVSIKLKLMRSCKLFSVLNLIQSIFGNDIESQSTEITKLRIFFLIIDSLPQIKNLQEIVSVLNNNFTNYDAVFYDGYSFGNKDIIVGNPPYVEYQNFLRKTTFDYGNVFADVLHHSVDMLNDNGIMAFVIPLSYVSTLRMAKIRRYVSSVVNKQIVVNFADRPDSLFSCVHQKLTIVVAQKNADYTGILSSSYNYWYRSERLSLFNGISLVSTDTSNFAYWPKIGNKIESDLYRKFLNMSGKSILDYSSNNYDSKIYINQRGCFWMKVFTHEIKSSSYTSYCVPAELVTFAYCAMNSSLFFLLWIIISDGWHVTNKELAFLKFPNRIGNNKVWDNLSEELEQKLEETKVYVGTKQIEYEYKHKFCKDIIDKIDNRLASVYKLSNTQLEYIKNYALKYRMSNGSKG